MADEQRPDRRLTPVQRRRLQARLTPEERQRLNDERRNLRKQLKRAQEARERESRQATSHQAVERVREAVALVNAGELLFAFAHEPSAGHLLLLGASQSVAKQRARRQEQANRIQVTTSGWK